MSEEFKLHIAECNWTCSRAGICHEYEDCDGESHFIQKLLPCPFCGDIPDLKDPDVLYPVGGEHNMQYDEENNTIIYTLWQLHCNKNGCGCGASVLADTRENCIKLWNTRV